MPINITEETNSKIHMLRQIMKQRDITIVDSNNTSWQLNKIIPHPSFCLEDLLILTANSTYPVPLKTDISSGVHNGYIGKAQIRLASYVQDVVVYANTFSKFVPSATGVNPTIAQVVDNIYLAVFGNSNPTLIGILDIEVRFITMTYSTDTSTWSLTGRHRINKTDNTNYSVTNMNGNAAVSNSSAFVGVKMIADDGYTKYVPMHFTIIRKSTISAIQNIAAGTFISFSQDDYNASPLSLQNMYFNKPTLDLLSAKIGNLQDSSKSTLNATDVNSKIETMKNKIDASNNMSKYVSSEFEKYNTETLYITGKNLIYIAVIITFTILAMILLSKLSLAQDVKVNEDNITKIETTVTPIVKKKKIKPTFIDSNINVQPKPIKTPQEEDLSIINKNVFEFIAD